MDVARRKELGDFLIKSRARRAPADVGLPSGPRRKTPGLRREEVASLAGVGPTWYTWLEQGRPINVSVRTLEAVANALGLTRSEREHMFRLADLLTDIDIVEDNIEIPEVARALVTKIEPYLGGVYSSSYDLLLFNQSYAACFPELVAASAGDRNILRYFAGLDDAHFTANENLVRTMIGRFRSNYSSRMANPRWRSLVEGVIHNDPRMKKYWDDHIVNDASDSVDTISTSVGDIVFTSSSFALASNPEINVLVGVPRTEEDLALLARLLRKR
jgi:transcriptional regulator with XRE-family HTH domain